jgi:hypothetical protein
MRPGHQEKNRGQGDGAAEPMPFGERHAHRAIAIHLGLALFIVFGVTRADHWFPFAASVVVVLCAFLFRRRQMYDEQRRDETMEDERDRQILALAQAWFRGVASAWAIALAVALALPAVRAGVATGFALPSLPLLGVVVAMLAENVAAARAYRRARG